VLSTAGANTQNGYQVNLYIALNGPHDDVIRVTDAEPTGSAVAAASNSGITATVIFSPGGSSALNSLTADDSGRLYYVDGQGRFTALEATNAPPQNGGGNNGGGTGNNGNNGSNTGNGGGNNGGGTVPDDRASAIAAKDAARNTLAPKTGDFTDTARWVLLGSFAASIIAAIIVTKIVDMKKKKAKEAAVADDNNDTPDN